MEKQTGLKRKKRSHVRGSLMNEEERDPYALPGLVWGTVRIYSLTHRDFLPCDLALNALLPPCPEFRLMGTWPLVSSKLVGTQGKRKSRIR